MHRRRLYLMRHGSVDYFDAKGRPLPPETVSLSPRGIEEARAAGRCFAQVGVQFDRVIVSGLTRTRQTAEHVLAALADAPAIEVCADWQEIRGGRLSAMSADELEQAFLGVFRDAASDQARFLGGESVAEFTARVLPPFQAFCADPDWQSALLVLHGGVNRVLLHHLLDGQARLSAAFEQAPACINAIDLGAKPGEHILRLINYAVLDPLAHMQRASTLEELYARYRAYASGQVIASGEKQEARA